MFFLGGSTKLAVGGMRMNMTLTNIMAVTTTALYSSTCHVLELNT